jgi:hypothetical protein
LLHLIACWSISGHIYHIYFPDCSLFLNFYFIDSTPFFVFTVLLVMVCFWHNLYISLIPFRRTAAVHI